MLKSAFSRFSAVTLAMITFTTTMAFAETANTPTNDDWVIELDGDKDNNNLLTSEVVEKFLGRLNLLRAKDPNHQIRVNMRNISGGNIENGFKMADAIYKAGNIDLACNGEIMSIAATVFSSYQGGKRIAAQDCHKITMHDLIEVIWSPTSGNFRMIRSQVTMQADNLNQALNIMSLGISQASGMPVESAKALFGADCHMSADEAYRIGLVDSFEGRGTPLPAKIKNITPEDIYEICKARPLMENVVLPDWSQWNFGIKNPQLVRN